MNLNHYFRLLMAVLLVLAMLLCAACGAKPTEPTNPNALGDGDGKLEAQDFVDGFTTMYGAALGALGGQTDVSSHTQMDVSLALSDSFVSSMGAALLPYAQPEDFAWMKNIGLNMDVNYTKELTKIVMALRLGNTEIASAEMIQDVAKQMVYLALPGISQQHIATNTEAAQGAVTVNMLGGVTDYAALVRALPTEAALNTLLTRYVSLALEYVQEPAITTETLSCGNISQDVTATTYTISNLEVLDMAEAVMKTAQTDVELEKMLDQLAVYYNAEGAKAAADGGYTWENVDIHQALMGEIQYALQEIGELRLEQKKDNFLVLSVFSADGEDVGIRIKMNPNVTQEEIRIYSLSQQEKTALLVEVGDQFCLSGTGTKREGLTSGNYVVSIQGTDMVYLDVQNVDTEALEKGNLQGTVSVRLSQQMITELFGRVPVFTTEHKLNIQLNTQSDSSAIECELYYGETYILGFAIRTKVLPAENIQCPKDFVEAENEADMMAWVDSLDLQKLLQNIRQAGVQEELVEALEMYLP